MRIVVEVRTEDEKPLQRGAWRAHRTVREHAAYLLHLKIQEEFLQGESDASESVPVAG